MKKVLYSFLLLFLLVEVSAQKTTTITKNKKGLLELNGKPIEGTRAQLTIAYEKTTSGPFCRDDRELIVVPLSDGSKAVFFHVPSNNWKFVTDTKMTDRIRGESYTFNPNCVARNINQINLSWINNDSTHANLTWGNAVIIK